MSDQTQMTREELERRVEAGSEDPEDYRNLADLLYRAGHVEEGLGLCRRVLSLPLSRRQRIELLLYYGWGLYELKGAKDEALSLARDSLSLLSEEAEDSEVLFWRGVANALIAPCMWHGNERAGIEAARRALRYLERAIDASENDKLTDSAYYYSAITHILLGEVDEAIVSGLKCRPQHTDDRGRLSVLITVANAFRLAGRFSEAEDALNEAARHLDADPGSLPRLLFERGSTQRAMDRPREARESFRELLQALSAHPRLNSDPDSLTEAYSNLAELAFEAEDYEEAREALEKVLIYHPQDYPLHWNTILGLGFCHLRLNDCSAAQGRFAEVLASTQASKEEKAKAQLGMLESEATASYKARRYEQARTAHLKLLDFYAGDETARNSTRLWLAACARQMGRYEETSTWLRQVLASSDASAEQRERAAMGLAALPGMPSKKIQ